jgi:hypothetical protein
MSTTLLIEILGWVGTVTYLIAYALVSLKKTEGDSVLYQGMNIFAGVLLVAYSLYFKPTPPPVSTSPGFASVSSRSGEMVTATNSAPTCMPRRKIQTRLRIIVCRSHQDLLIHTDSHN